VIIRLQQVDNGIANLKYLNRITVTGILACFPG